MMNLSAKQKIYLIIGIIALIFGLLIFFMVKPLLFHINQTGLKFKETREKVLFLQQKRNDTKNLEKYYSGFQEPSERIEKAFLNTSAESILIFFSFLDDLSKKIKVNIDVGHPAEKNENFPKISSALTITGSLESTVRFLEALENLPYFLEIKQLETKFTEQDNPVKTRLVIVIYAQK